MMQPACTDLFDGLSGVAGRERREKPGLPVFGKEEGKEGRQRPRGSENEEGFVTATDKHLSDPDDTPEDEEEDEEAELFLWWRRGATGEFSVDLHGLSGTGGDRL